MLFTTQSGAEAVRTRSCEAAPLAHTLERLAGRIYVRHRAGAPHVLQAVDGHELVVAAARVVDERARGERLEGLDALQEAERREAPAVELARLVVAVSEVSEREG
jgi:hypothetical protein